MRIESEEQDLHVEVESYIELLTEEKMRLGMGHREAERQARIEIGGIEQTKERIRESRHGGLIEAIGRGLSLDLRHALRTLSRRPLYASTAILAFCLGIGATSTVFSVAYGILLRPLPFEHPDDLAEIHMTSPDSTFVRDAGTVQQVVRWRESATSLTSVSGFQSAQHTLAGGVFARTLFGVHVEPDFFQTLGVSPLIGRDFLPEDYVDGRVVLLSHRLWRNDFGEDPGIVGTTLHLDGSPALRAANVDPMDILRVS
jgi:hypothetical protein